MNDVWTGVLDLLGMLNGENVSRRDYVMTPEFLEAEKKLSEMEKQCEVYLNGLPDEEQKKFNNYLECVDEAALRREQRAYLQGCADCVQVLVKMGLMKVNKNIVVQ